MPLEETVCGASQNYPVNLWGSLHRRGILWKSKGLLCQ